MMLGNRTDFDYTEGTSCPSFFTSPSAFFASFFAKRRRGDDKKRRDVEKTLALASLAFNNISPRHFDNFVNLLPNSSSSCEQQISPAQRPEKIEFAGL